MTKEEPLSLESGMLLKAKSDIIVWESEIFYNNRNNIIGRIKPHDVFMVLGKPAIFRTTSVPCLYYRIKCLYRGGIGFCDSFPGDVEVISY